MSGLEHDDPPAYENYDIVSDMPRSVQDQILARIRASRPGAVFCRPTSCAWGAGRRWTRPSRVSSAPGSFAGWRVASTTGRGSTRRLGGPAAVAAARRSCRRALDRKPAPGLGPAGGQPARRLDAGSRAPRVPDGRTAHAAIRVGSRVIEFRHASPRTLTGAGDRGGRRDPGAALPRAQRNHARSRCSRPGCPPWDDDRSAVQRYASRAPAWMRPPLLAIAKRGRRARAG